MADSPNTALAPNREVDPNGDALSELKAAPVGADSEQKPTQTEEKDLDSTSFEFSLKGKYRKLRQESAPEVRSSKLSRLSPSSVREASRKGFEKRSTVSSNGSGPEIDNSQPKTVLDRFMNWLAERIKAIEEFLLKLVGVEPKKSQEELDEEEELEELALANLSINMKADKEEEEEEKEVPLSPLK